MFEEILIITTSVLMTEPRLLYPVRRVKASLTYHRSLQAQAMGTLGHQTSPGKDRGANWCHSGKQEPCQEFREHLPVRLQEKGFGPWVRKILWRRKWQPTPVFLPREIGQQTEEPGGLQSMGSQQESDMQQRGEGSLPGRPHRSEEPQTHPLTYLVVDQALNDYQSRN